MREGWKEVTLGEILEIKHGYGFKGEYFTDEETEKVLVTPGNFHIGGGFKNDKLKFYNGPVKENFILNEDDVIVTMTDLSKMADTIGFSAKVPKNLEKIYLHNQRIGLVKLLDDSFDLNFIYWLLRTDKYQRYIAGSAIGATVKHTSPAKIYTAKIKVPIDKNVQQRIASILSAYDDLIENNLKRIKLLEEMAQQTYEEWFVRMRGFDSAQPPPPSAQPSSQPTEIAETHRGLSGVEVPEGDALSLPEGWEKVKLGEICNLVMGQSPKSEDYNIDGNGLPFHQGVKDYGFRFPINNSWSTSGNKKAIPNSILFSVRAPVGRLNVASEEIIIGRGLAAINDKNGLNSFLFYQLRTIFFEDNLIGGGAIYASVTKNDVERIELIYPEKLAKKFNEFASTIDKEILNLTSQNQRLRESRDILLPRLMMGMIEV